MWFVQRANIREARNQSAGSSTRTTIQGRTRNEGTVMTGIVRAKTGTETTETERRRRGIGTGMTGTRGRRSGSETDDQNAFLVPFICISGKSMPLSLFSSALSTPKYLIDQWQSRRYFPSVGKIKFSVRAAFNRTRSWPQHQKFDLQANASRQKAVVLRAAFH